MQEYFWGASARKTYVYILKSCLEKGQRFEENLWRGIGLLRMNSVEIFWMINKTIIEFSFRTMWRIILISVIIFSSICITVYVMVSLIK